MPSIYGCPLECPVTNRHLCSGNGHCAYDWDRVGARCYCNHGWTGADCSDSDGSQGLNYSPAILGLSATLFFIVVLLVAGIFLMIQQVKAYRDDMTHYQMLSDGDP
jgi:hypothetical protein